MIFMVSCEKEQKYSEIKKNHKALYVLEYHSIAADDNSVMASTFVSQQKFEADLKWLSDNGYTTVLPREIVYGVEMPEKPVILTFDDGYYDNYVYLFPLLKKYNMKAVINVLVSNIVSDERRPFLSWTHCREMVESGLVELGSHTYDLHYSDETDMHANGIARMNGESDEDYRDRVMYDLIKSVQIIEEEVGTTVVSFAYPYGITDKFIFQDIKKMFPITFCSSEGIAKFSSNMQYLPRFCITNDRDLSSFMF